MGFSLLRYPHVRKKNVGFSSAQATAFSFVALVVAYTNHAGPAVLRYGRTAVANTTVIINQINQMKSLKLGREKKKVV